MCLFFALEFFSPGEVTTTDSPLIIAENLPIITPNQDVVISSLSLQVNRMGYSLLNPLKTSLEYTRAGSGAGTL